MAYNVFGIPITTTTLEGMPEYAEKNITRRDRAVVANHLKNSQDKDRKALNYAKELKEEFGRNISTFCLVYNATGDRLTLVNQHDWHESSLGPAPFPTRIENGQWGVFLHLEPTKDTYGSHGAVVYSGLNKNDVICNWMVSWINPSGKDSYDNSVYAEIREEGYYANKDRWDEVHKILDKYANKSTRPTDRSNLFYIAHGKASTTSVSIGNGNTVIFEAILTSHNV